ncbi:hypothetical protein [Faecalitalea cylindroides]|uniref:DUF4809 domain-containing protein n=1 Tax=Faecalitalea cylindroides TaxID=39483 RepID=A0AAW6FTV9_9FIRM|nr:hypothetical protein [Faecalitalea cylindroides]MDC0828350.1 hypothetical protein [Faecalitalea cylindroides]
MNRYVIYRCPEGCDCHQKLKEHELIGATVAETLEEALPEIYEQVRLDILTFQPEEYSQGVVDFELFEEEEHSRKYQYSFEAIFTPEDIMYAGSNGFVYALQEIPVEL